MASTGVQRQLQNLARFAQGGPGLWTPWMEGLNLLFRL